MKDLDCVEFLQNVLPQLHLRWAGFRQVRGQVCKRLQRRLEELELDNLAAYRVYLEAHPQEWSVLDAACRITISRFYRDRNVFDYLRQEVLPELVQRATTRGDSSVRCWSAGCASGEEVYTLKIIWDLCLLPYFPNLPLKIVATDTNAHLLERARTGCYEPGSLKELPLDWWSAAFDRVGQQYCIRPNFRVGIEFCQQDIREQMPDERFHLILCRNLAFTYFEESLQREILQLIVQRLLPAGVLVVGKRESLPPDTISVQAYTDNLGVYIITPKDRSPCGSGS